VIFLVLELIILNVESARLNFVADPTDIQQSIKVVRYWVIFLSDFIFISSLSIFSNSMTVGLVPLCLE
jgi:hypothetical protein